MKNIIYSPSGGLRITWVILGILILIGSVNAVDNWSTWSVSYGNVSSYAGGDEVIGHDAIDIKSNGDVCILYEHSKTLYYDCFILDETASGTGETREVWTVTPTTEPYLLDYALILDTNDYPYVCYVTGDGVNNYLRFARLGKLNTFNETNFTDTKIETCGIALDEYNAPHIVYKEKETDFSHEIFEFCPGGTSSNCGIWTDSDTIGNEFSDVGIAFREGNKKVLATARFIAGGGDDHAYIYEADYDNYNVDGTDLLYKYTVGTVSGGDLCDITVDEDNNFIYTVDREFATGNYTVIKNNDSIGFYTGGCPSLDSFEGVVYGYYQDGGGLYEIETSTDSVSTPVLKFVSTLYPPSIAIDENRGILYVLYTYVWGSEKLVRISSKKIGSLATCDDNEGIYHLNTVDQNLQNLGNVSVTFIWYQHDYTETLISNETGWINYNPPFCDPAGYYVPFDNLDIYFEKDGYDSDPIYNKVFICDQDEYAYHILTERETNISVGFIVRDLESNKRLPNATILLSSYSGGVLLTNITDVNGFVEFRGLTAGIFDYSVYHSDYKLYSELGVSINSSKVINIYLLNITTRHDLKVFVTNKSGSAINKVRVLLSSGNNNREGWTNTTGYVDFSYLYPEKTRVLAYKEGYTQEYRYTYLEYEYNNITVTIEKDEDVYQNRFCVVNDVTGEPVVKANIHLKAYGINESNNDILWTKDVKTLADGCKMVDLPDGYYSLNISQYGYISLFIPKEKYAGRNEVYRLSPHGNILTVSVLVYNLNGSHLDNSAISILDLDGNLLMSCQSGDYHFCIFNLLSGKYEFCATNDFGSKCVIESVNTDPDEVKIYIGVTQQQIWEQFIYWILYFWWLPLTTILGFFVCVIVLMLRTIFK